MGFLYTLGVFTFAGVASRVLALGLQNRPLSSAAGTSALWVTGWATAGYSFHQWKTEQEREYVKRLQYLVDRKERRDKWDEIYHQVPEKQ